MDNTFEETGPKEEQFFKAFKIKSVLFNMRNGKFIVASLKTLANLNVVSKTA